MRKDIVFLRGGGLGDFILTLPLLKAAYQQGFSVSLYANENYLSLLNKEWNWLLKKDLDELCGKAPSILKGSQVVSFWDDSDWKNEMINAGASITTSLNPRPGGGQLFILQALEEIGWSIPGRVLREPILGNHWKGGDQVLWIHPGSGGIDKNLPISYFLSRANQWLLSREDRQVVISFGEADEKLFSKFQMNNLVHNSKVQLFRFSSILDFRDRMASLADKFIGNDSGPGHLAANLGIPVEIGFRSTPSSVWSPLGPRVEVYDWDSVSSKIL